MTLVLMFPGQSSRYAGMVNKLLTLAPESRQLLERSSELLGRDLARQYAADNPRAFASNRDVQVGVFLANHMFLQILNEQQIHADASLGLSLGEWNHLVHVGALPFEDALLAVEERGNCYDAGPPGAMVSVFPILRHDLDHVVERAQEGDVLEVVNLNSPRQYVLSGRRSAIDRALRILDEEYFVSAVVIEERIPMHSSLFEPVGQRFRRHLEALSFSRPRLPYLPNRDARFCLEPDFVDLLATHVHQPVLWRKSVDLVVERWPGAFLLEVGPKSVLTNLIDRKWHPGVNKASMDSASATAEHLVRVLGRVREETIDGAA